MVSRATCAICVNDNSMIKDQLTMLSVQQLVLPFPTRCVSRSRGSARHGGPAGCSSWAQNARVAQYFSHSS